ncbi:hypothetical protein ACFPN2_33665 [Steroidobacter flavus]|uniref:Uncharacterized protein n=1 Tax=Steroidobacter flavus TaxID=1842136 RepID=A0ABV8T4M9_9GAMM
MDRKEIHSTVGGVCVYRKRIKQAQFIVQSIYLLPYTRGHTTYHVSVEFEPLTLVEQGEGVRWGTSSDDLESIIQGLESFIQKPLGEWTHQTKIEFYDSEIVTNEHYQNSWNVFRDKYQNGKLLLPKGLQFTLQTPLDIGTLKNRSKYRRPDQRTKA